MLCGASDDNAGIGIRKRRFFGSQPSSLHDDKGTAMSLTYPTDPPLYTRQLPML